MLPAFFAVLLLASFAGSAAPMHSRSRTTWHQSSVSVVPPDQEVWAVRRRVGGSGGGCVRKARCRERERVPDSVSYIAGGGGEYAPFACGQRSPLQRSVAPQNGCHVVGRRGLWEVVSHPAWGLSIVLMYSALS